MLDAEKAFTAAVAVKDYSRDVGLDEARAALAATVATTPAGLAVITGFIREVTRQIGDAYFQDGEAVMFADSLDAAVAGLRGFRRGSRKIMVIGHENDDPAPRGAEPCLHLKARRLRYKGETPYEHGRLE